MQMNFETLMISDFFFLVSAITTIPVICLSFKVTTKYNNQIVRNAQRATGKLQDKVPITPRHFYMSLFNSSACDMHVFAGVITMAVEGR